MARPKKDAEAIESSAKKEADAEIEEVLAQLPDAGAKVFVYREHAKIPNEFEYVTEMDSSAFNIGAIAQGWGGGRYRIKIQTPDQKFRKQHTFRIAAPIVAAVAPMLGAADKAQERLDRMFEIMLTGMMNQQKADPMALVTALAGVLRPASDPADLAIKLAGLLRPADGDGGVSTLLKGIELG